MNLCLVLFAIYFLSMHVATTCALSILRASEKYWQILSWAMVNMSEKINYISNCYASRTFSQTQM